MKTSIAATILTFFVGITAIAQNFDSDSVYYSPIQKATSKQTQRLQKVQEDVRANSKKFSYFFTLQTGALIGCKECSFGREISFSSATVHGVTIGRKLRVGAGLGFDTYQNWQTVPLFGSVSWDLFGNKNKNALFLQFNYGWAKAMANMATLSYYQDVDGGRMVSTQVGYRIRYHDLKIAFGIGSKYQRVSASYGYPSYYYDFVGTLVPGNFSRTTLRESMNRLSLMISIGWK